MKKLKMTAEERSVMNVKLSSMTENTISHISMNGQFAQLAMEKYVLNLEKVNKTILNITYQHKSACIQLEKWFKNLPLNRPNFKIITKTRKAAGFYHNKHHLCIYPLSYALIGGNKYIEVIKHEVVHAYQWQLMPDCQPHGETFKFLMTHVMGYRRKVYNHQFSVNKAKMLGQILEICYDKNTLQDLQSNAQKQFPLCTP